MIYLLLEHCRNVINVSSTLSDVNIGLIQKTYLQFCDQGSLQQALRLDVFKKIRENGTQRKEENIIEIKSEKIPYFHCLFAIYYGHNIRY